MKTYITPTELRLVGKAYEIRRKLRTMLNETKRPHEPLSRRLEHMSGLPPASVRHLTPTEPHSSVAAKRP